MAALVLGVALAAALVVVIGVGRTGETVPALLSLGALVGGGLCAGALLFTTCCTGPGRAWPTAADRAGSVSLVVVAGVLWCASAGALGVVTAPDRGYWLATAAIALLVTVAVRFAGSWRLAALLTAVSLLGVLIPSLTTGVSRGAAQDLGSNAAVLYTLAGSCWFGALFALLLLGAGGGAPNFALAVRRYRAIAGVCWLTLLITVVLIGGVQLEPHEVLTTTYGRLYLVGIALLLALGGHVLNRQRPARAPRVVLVGLGVGAGITVALGLSAPPAASLSATDALLGYDLPHSPTVGTLLTLWRFDLVLGTASILLAGIYLFGVLRLHRRGDAWPVGRTATWLLGCFFLLVTCSSGIGTYSRAMFSAYMVENMALNMFVPVLLALGGPVTLALRTLPSAGNATEAGPREWLLSAIHSPLARVLTNPVVSIAIFLVTLYGLYFTGIFAAAVVHPWGYELMNIHFLVAGYLFYWSIIGIDPGPRRPPFLGRLGVLFAIMPFHAFFGVAVMLMSSVIAQGFYGALDLPWMHSLISDEHTGGAIAWVSGEVPLLLVAISLMAQWARQDERQAARQDRHTKRYGDADFDAYNAMLAELARTRR